MSEFSDKVVLVTGGTRGIGRACAAMFAQAGATVALCGRSADTSRQAAEELSSETGGEVHGFEADISNSSDVDKMVSAITETLGPISILVNNAGITKDGLLMRMKDAAWDEVLRTNLDGVFYCCRAVSRGMIKQRYGRIVTVSSIVGLHGQAGQTNYAAAKAGLIGFTKSLAQELAKRNVTANVVAPGYIATDMTSDFSEETRQQLTDQIPLGRSGEAEEVAAAVKFLSSDAASYITGHVLMVDGGLAM